MFRLPHTAMSTAPRYPRLADRPRRALARLGTHPWSLSWPTTLRLELEVAAEAGAARPAVWCWWWIPQPRLP